MRVRPLTLSADRVELAVGSGAWLRDPVVAVSRGSLGVALDDATGFVVAANVLPGKWPVSLGIRLDFLADPPTDGRPMSAVGELVACDERSGLTRGFVADHDGRVIALVTQRSHLIAAESPPRSKAVPIAEPASEPIRTALGIVETTPGVLVMEPNPLAANGMGNVHGGILICGAEFAALSALASAADLRVTSIDIVYVRPCSAAGTTTFGADVVHQGRSLAVVRVTATNSLCKPCAIATVTVAS